MTNRSFVEKHLCRRSPLSYILFPLSLVFSLILLIRRILYKFIFSQYRAPVYVISIGNIIAGGSGKTPFTMYIALLLMRNGFKVAISHRGYKSSLENRVTLISDESGLLPAAELAGDEAWLIAKSLEGIPVVAGKDRTEAIKLLCMKFSDLDFVILDDSFQHLKVKHDLDIVIVSNELGFGNGFVLPAGYLREPKSGLKQADILILNFMNDNDKINGTIKKTLDELGKDVYRGFYKPESVYDFQGREVAPARFEGKKVMLLAGIGNPDSFAETAKSLSFTIAEKMYLADHVDYESQAIRGLIISVAQRADTQWILTTEKDYSKLRKYTEFNDMLLTVKVSFGLCNSEEKLINYLKHKMPAPGMPN